MVVGLVVVVGLELAGDGGAGGVDRDGVLAAGGGEGVGVGVRVGI